MILLGKIQPNKEAIRILRTVNEQFSEIAPTHQHHAIALVNLAFHYVHDGKSIYCSIYLLSFTPTLDPPNIEEAKKCLVEAEEVASNSSHRAYMYLLCVLYYLVRVSYRSIAFFNFKKDVD